MIYDFADAVPVASQPAAIVAVNLGSGKVTIGAIDRPGFAYFAGVAGLSRPPYLAPARPDEPRAAGRNDGDDGRVEFVEQAA